MQKLKALWLKVWTWAKGFLKGKKLVLENEDGVHLFEIDLATYLGKIDAKIQTSSKNVKKLVWRGLANPAFRQEILANLDNPELLRKALVKVSTGVKSEPTNNA